MSISFGSGNGHCSLSLLFAAVGTAVVAFTRRVCFFFILKLMIYTPLL
jgi:hypothetical protein